MTRAEQIEEAARALLLNVGSRREVYRGSGQMFVREVESRWVEDLAIALDTRALSSPPPHDVEGA